MKKVVCTFILNILRSYSSNLRLQISRLLKETLLVISISISQSFHSDVQFQRRVWGREEVSDFCFMSVSKV